MAVSDDEAAVGRAGHEAAVGRAGDEPAVGRAGDMAAVGRVGNEAAAVGRPSGETAVARAEGDGRRRFVVVMVAVTVISLVGFGIVEWIDPPFLAEDVWMRESAAPWVAVVGLALLLADLVLPVPSSVVMIFLGRALGFPAGAALSWLATTLSALLAFWIGRRMGRRARPPASMEKRLSSHGVLVVAVTRPVPVLAETAAVAAGMVPSMTWRRMIIGAVAGTAPPAVLFAAAGAFAHGTSGALLIGACLLIDIAVWYAERTHRRRSARVA